MRSAGGILNVFAYGSLIWKPPSGFIVLEKVRAYGWRRSFCLNLTTFRGTPDQPGLMLALDRGGCCDGVLMRADEGSGVESIEGLLRREIDYAEDVASLRWIPVRNGNGKVTALTFYAAPRGDGVFIHLPLEEQASRIARAAGSAGSCAAYLHNTVVKLLEHGIHDSYLWKLQALVADEIRVSGATVRSQRAEP
jgi:cation transport protein ChaC